MGIRNIVKAGLGGIFRDTLVEESYVVAAWALAEITNTRIRDIAFERNNGTLAGSGTTRAVALELPEGGLGMTFNGSGKITVVDDVLGFILPGDSSERNLSLEGGAGDITFLMKTSTNDATLRCIAGKTVTNSSGNGWYVALQSGGIVFSLKVAGASVFNFSRGSVADGAWHLIQCHMRRAADGGVGARVIIDGVATGADVAYSTTPAYTTTDFRIGMFVDDAGGYIGSLSYLMVSRSGDTTLSTRLQLCRSWTDISADLNGQQEISAELGLSSNDLLVGMASPGRLSFGLNNFAAGSRPIGYYSPGHANVRSGWKERIPVIWILTDDVSITETRFHGFIESITPTTGLYREKRVAVEATTWLGFVMNSSVRNAPVLTSVTSGAAFGAVLDEALRPPIAVSIAAGDSTFAYCLDDTSDAPLLQVASRIVISEGGLAYEKADGTLVYEAQSDRTANITAVDTFDDDVLIGLSASRSISRIKNRISVTQTPREVSGSLVVLGDMNGRVQILAEETLYIEISYRDPSQRVASVGGTTITTPVITTDYTMTANEDGTGTSLSAYAVVTVDASWKGGGATKIRVYNSGTATGWFQTQIRGYALYAFDSVTVPVEDGASQRSYGQSEQKVDLDYQSSSALAKRTGSYLLLMQKDPLIMPQGGVVVGVSSNQARLLQRDIGDMVNVEESMSGLVSSRFMISNIHLTARTDALLQGEYDYRLTPSRFLWILGESGFSELDSTTTVAP